MKRLRLPRLFFGWWTVIGGGILGAWMGGFAFYGFAALFKPIATELGFSRAVTSVAASISRLEGSIESPIAGWATDKFGPKWIVLAAVLSIASGLILMYYVNSLWSFYLVWGIIVGAGANLRIMPLETAISNWFVKKRGLALGIRWTINGMSPVLVLPLVAWLITVQDWRTTCVLGGIVALIIGLVVIRFCLKRYRPEYYGLLPDGVATQGGDISQTIDKGVRYAAEVGEVEFSLKQAMKTPSFWLLNLAAASHGIAMPVITVHGIPFLTDIGFEPLRAAAMMSLMAGVGLPLRTVGGWLADRFKRDNIRLLLALAIFLQAVGFTIFLLNQTTPMVYLWFIVYGLGNGLTYVQFAIWARHFGRKAIGSIRGMGNFFTSPVGMAAPIYAGWVYDTTGSYISAFTITAVLLGIAVILVVLAKPPKPPTEITDIRKIV